MFYNVSRNNLEQTCSKKSSIKSSTKIFTAKIGCYEHAGLRQLHTNLRTNTINMTACCTTVCEQRIHATILTSKENSNAEE